ncbi:hypothetical protein SLEP1_g6272 [Rubroshorea leprosula]|uniref:Uncharacterized protein n=1 Tax=Rubroshorea leprosula TaxID=152421 RepID=A0AAV5HZ71_9ROSI|nr:hypothetical protein SLEP1_g6272 [Rubroshorea leprosula]
MLTHAGTLHSVSNKLENGIRIADRGKVISGGSSRLGKFWRKPSRLPPWLSANEISSPKKPNAESAKV